MTPTSLVGGMGSLTPMPQRQRLPELPRTVPGQSQIERTMPSAREIATAPGTTIATYPTSGIGQPPITRSVPSVPMSMAPTQAEIDRAPGQVIGTYPTRPMGSASGNIIEQRAEQLGLRPAVIPGRLMPGVAAQNYDVGINGPAGLTRQQFAALPFPGAAPQMAGVPFPRPRPQIPTPQRSIVPARVSPQPMARMVQAASPLRVVVNGGTYRQVAAPIAPQLTSAQRYDQLIAASRGNPSVEDRVSGRTGLSSYSGSAQSLSS